MNEQPQGEGNAGSADATDMSAAMGNLAGRYFKPQTKEGVLNAAGEVLLVRVYRAPSGACMRSYISQKSEDSMH